MKDEIVQFKSLCEATEQFLKPLCLSKGDRLHVALDDKGKNFLTKTYGEKHIHRTLVHAPTEFSLRDAAPSWTVDTKVGFASLEANSTWPDRVPEKTRLTGYGEMKYPCTDTFAILLHSLWPRAKVTFDCDAYTVYEFLLMRFVHQLHGACERARRVGDPNGELLDRLDNPRASYQTTALKGAMHQEGTALFMEQGTGKSAVVVARVCNEARGNYCVLIVCPKNVRTNWRNEFIKFATTDGKLIVLQGGKLERVKQLIEAFVDTDDKSRWTVVICSYESVSTTWDAIKMCRWNLGVLDESHFIKSTYTKRYAQMIELRDRCDQRMCLTGTPVTQGPFDLYAQFEFLGEGLSGFRTFSAFRSFYGVYIKNVDGCVTLVGLQNVPLLKERIARLAFVIKKSEALPHLPDKVYDVIDVEMNKEQKKTYCHVAEFLLAEIENDLEGAGAKKQIVVRNALTKLLRLAQITSGFVITQNINIDKLGPKLVHHFDPNPKMEELVEILKSKDHTEKTIVWSCWVSNIKLIRARLEYERIGCVTYFGQTSDKDRAIAEDRFASDPNCKVLIGNPAAGGTGLNLLGYGTEEDKTDCTHVIYFSQNWSMPHRAHSEDRAHRRGTRRRVRYTDLVVLNSIDEQIRHRVMSKRLLALEIQDIREILQGLISE